MIFWALGFAVGFMLWPKIRPYLHRIYVVPWFWPCLATITIGIGLGMGKGCTPTSFDTFSLKELLRQLLPHQVSAQTAPARSVTPIIANANLPDVLGSLRKRRHEDELRERKQQTKQLRVDARMALSIAEAPTQLIDHIVVHGTRKGPFCHLTCAVHHGTTDEHVWDAETLPEFCRANYLPPATHFPAWTTMTFATFDGRTMKEDKIDTLHDYCGPIPSPDCEPGGGEKHPLQSYRLYWKP
jgi:hypothetical protein